MGNHHANGADMDDTDPAENVDGVQKATHEIGPELPLDTQSLFREWRMYIITYEPGQNESQMSKGTVLRFLKDFSKLFRVPYAKDLAASIRNGDATHYSFQQFVAFALQAHNRSKKHIDLSESLETQAAYVFDGSSDVPERSVSSNIIKKGVLIDIRPSSTLEVRSETNFTPPAQLMMREWSLIFTLLSNRDLDRLNATCRFFRSVLFKYPPET
jgi:hypothetical protein